MKKSNYQGRRVCRERTVKLLRALGEILGGVLVCLGFTGICIMLILLSAVNAI